MNNKFKFLAIFCISFPFFSFAEKWVAISKPGPKWDKSKPWNEQPLKKHGQYHGTLFQKGKVLFGGPFLDSKGGLTIFEVENEKELQKLLVEDPAVVDGLLIFEHHPWMPFLNSLDK